MSLQDFLELFEAKTQKSRTLWREACRALPGGVPGSSGFLAPNPVYIDRAQGGKLIDVDGNEYIDLLLGGFPNILGHSPSAVVDAVKKQLDRGTSFMLFQQTGLDLTRKLQKLMPHLESLRFCNTGTEATMFAIRAARSWTRKVKIAKPEGGYNGQHDYVLLSVGLSGHTAGPDERPQPVAESAGTPDFALDNSVIFPWNDIEASVAIIEENAAELAAVMVEPVQGFGSGSIPPEPGYLEALREVCSKHNVLLIYDEIVTGFRLAGTGGAVAHYGVTPDLACYGKVIGGGFPIGAFGGRRDIMEKTLSPAADPAYKIFQSGSFTGNAISMTAGLACVTALEQMDYAAMDGRAQRLRKGLADLAAARGFDLNVTGICSVLYPHFNAGPVRNLRDKLNDDAARNREFCMGMVANGVYMPPGHPSALCFAHSDADMETILAVAGRVFERMQQ